jgi:hypothetical protein
MQCMKQTCVAHISQTDSSRMRSQKSLLHLKSYQRIDMSKHRAAATMQQTYLSLAMSSGLVTNAAALPATEELQPSQSSRSAHGVSRMVPDEMILETEHSQAISLTGLDT